METTEVPILGQDVPHESPTRVDGSGVQESAVATTAGNLAVNGDPGSIRPTMEEVPKTQDEILKDIEKATNEHVKDSRNRGASTSAW